MTVLLVSFYFVWCELFALIVCLYFIVDSALFVALVVGCVFDC